jgi:hypothetical protein
MLAKRHVVGQLWWLIYVYKKKKMGRHSDLAIIEIYHIVIVENYYLVVVEVYLCYLILL